MKIIVIANIEVEGFHYYPNAPEMVSFLRNLHRHIFTIKAGYSVNNPNREKEIFILQEKLYNLLFSEYGKPCLFKNNSCEMIATFILNNQEGCIWAEVLEDGKGGARVEL